MGADLCTWNKLWNALYHDVGTIKDEAQLKNIRELLEKKLTEKKKIGDSKA